MWCILAAPHLHSNMVRYTDDMPTGSLMPYIQLDERQMTDTHRCSNTKTRRAATKHSHFTSQQHLRSPSWRCSWLKAQPQRPRGGLRSANGWAHSNTAKSYSWRPIGSHHSSGVLSSKQALLHKRTTHVHVHRLIRDIRQNLIRGNTLIRFASIWFALWIFLRRWVYVCVSVCVHTWSRSWAPQCLDHKTPSVLITPPLALARTGGRNRQRQVDVEMYSRVPKPLT